MATNSSTNKSSADSNQSTPASSSTRPEDQSGEGVGAVGAQPEQFEKPKAQVAAEKAAGERADEVRDQQWEAQKQNLTNVPSDPTTVVHARRDGDKAPESAVFGFDGSTVTLTTTSKILEFGREEFLGLLRAAAKIGGSL